MGVRVGGGGIGVLVGSAICVGVGSNVRVGPGRSTDVGVKVGVKVGPGVGVSVLVGVGVEVRVSTTGAVAPTGLAASRRGAMMSDVMPRQYRSAVARPMTSSTL